MRVLLKCAEDNSLVTKEITAIYFNDEENGLGMRDTENDLLYIPNISKETCNELCISAYRDGQIDLSMYDDYFYE